MGDGGDTSPDLYTSLSRLAQEMRTNSERWFPDLHAAPVLPLRVFYALGLAGECGEVANVIKKTVRMRPEYEDDEGVGPELADVFAYLLLLADECGIDLIAEYRAKVEINEKRWG